MIDYILAIISVPIPAHADKITAPYPAGSSAQSIALTRTLFYRAFICVLITRSKGVLC